MDDRRRRFITPDGGLWQYYQDQVFPWVMFTEVRTGRYVTGAIREQLVEPTDEQLTATLKEVWKRHGGPSGRLK